MERIATNIALDTVGFPTTTSSMLSLARQMLM